MANPSLQIGNDNWAIKEDNLLGYSTAGTRFVPQPITMTRATLGTRVNLSGLVEDVELLGSELVTNGDFENNVIGWNKFKSNATESWNAGGYLDFTKTGNSGRLGSDVSLETNKTYKISVNVISLGGIVNLYVGLSDFESPYAGVSSTHLVVGTNTFYLTFAGSASSKGVYLQSAGTDYYGLTASIDSISVKEIQGNPAIMTNQTSSDIENGSPYADLVQNGDFATGDFTSWVNNTSGNASIVNNQCVFTNASSGNNIQQTPPIVIGKTYISTFDIISITQGAFKIYADSGSGKSDVGKYSFTWTATDTNWYVRAAGTTSGVIDNVTVEEVNTGLQGYWKMGDGTNDEYPVIYDQTNPTLGSDISVWAGEDANVGAYVGIESNTTTALVVGKMYKVAFTVSNYTSGSFKFRQPSGLDLGATGTSNGDYVNMV